MLLENHKKHLENQQSYREKKGLDLFSAFFEGMVGYHGAFLD